MFLNPWYAGQPSAGGQPSGVGGPPENGHAPSSPSPEEVHPTYSSDPGQDLIVEQSDLSDEQMKHLATVQQALRPGWTVHLTTEGRFYYCNHYNQTRLGFAPANCVIILGQLREGHRGQFFYTPFPRISTCVRTADTVMFLHTWHSPAM